jgi:hypothetical protein
MLTIYFADRYVDVENESTVVGARAPTRMPVPEPINAELDNTVLPPTYKLPPIPTPPDTRRAPELVDVDCVTLVNLRSRSVIEPRAVIDCNVDVFQTVTIPEAVLTAVSVPALSSDTP